MFMKSNFGVLRLYEHRKTLFTLKTRKTNYLSM